MTVTVFTPAYNRAYVLPRLYESLCKQTCKDFEWVVVDDGSTDDTSGLFTEWKDSAEFPINYIRQENGGKHRAINRGIKEANGELFFIVDSDDKIPDYSIEFIVSQWDTIKDDYRLCGISGIDVYPDGKTTCGVDNFGIIDASNVEIRLKYGIRGDMAEIFRTDIMRKFPFPEFDGELFCPEDLVWNRIGKQYKLRYTCKPLYICEYLPDGLTAKIAKIRKHSPLASMTYYSEYSRLEIPIKELFKTYINFWRFTPLKYFRRACRMIGVKGIPFILPGWMYRIKEYKL